MGEISGVASSLPEGANSSAMKSRSMPRSAWSSAPSSPPKLRLDLGRVGWVFGSGGGGGRAHRCATDWYRCVQQLRVAGRGRAERENSP